MRCDGTLREMALEYGATSIKSKLNYDQSDEDCGVGDCGVSSTGEALKRY